MFLKMEPANPSRLTLVGQGPEIVAQILTDLEYHDIVSLCNSSASFRKLCSSAYAQLVIQEKWKYAVPYPYLKRACEEDGTLEFCEDEEFWMERFRQDFPEDKGTPEDVSWKNHYKAAVNNFYGKKLVLAASTGNLDLVKDLVENFGVDVGYHGIQSPLFAALQDQNLNFDMVKYLVENGADVNYRSESGVTPLMAASSFQPLEIVQYLVDNGANISDIDNSGDNALIYAVDNEEFFPVLQYLVQSRIDIDNSGGVKTLDHVFMNVTHENQVKYVKYLLENGASFNMFILKENFPLLNPDTKKYLKETGII